MAWTQSDVDKLRDAIMAIATGTRVVSVSYAGPPARTATYQAAELGEMRKLLASVEAAVTPTQSYRLARTRKGLD